MAKMTGIAAQREKRERNARVQVRYDELDREGKHGHYETMFRVVREEVERARAAENEACARVVDEINNGGNHQWGETLTYVASSIRARLKQGIGE